jgi:pyruvate/2-oxoglutarate dehydrogenase complex dihydrolipoamide acyltransferase (E2) component
MNVNDDQAVIVAWQMASGRRVDSGSPIATLETTKVTFDVSAPCTGYLFYRHAAKSVVAVGSTLAWITDEPDTSIETLTGASAVLPAAAPAGTPEGRLTRKAIRRMSELGVRPEELPPEGKLEAADIERIAATRTSAGEPLEQSTAKMLEVARLTQVYRSAVPSVVTVPLSADRVQTRLRALAADIGPLSLLELVVREAPAVLANYPELNGYYGEGRAWTYREIAIGFAVNGQNGLRVPVVRDSAARSQLDVCRAVRDLTLRYCRGELSVEDVTGGTFTVTDLSGDGVTHMIPVLNDRQAGILGICAPQPGGQQNLVLAFDHRMTDGMRAAGFLRDLRDRVEA